MIVCNAYGQLKVIRPVNIDTIPNIDTGQTTIGIITTKKGQDTVKVYAIIQNKTTKKQYKAFIYSVRQVYKWSEHNTPGSKPQYFYTFIKYLGQDKKELPGNIKVIKAEEIK
jgi:hypothetical protein